MEKIESICMSQYSYKENLLYTSKESQVYKASNKNHPNFQPFVFKGYSQSYLTDPIKEKKLMQELNSLWKLHGKENILQIITQHSRDKKVFIITQFCQYGNLAQQIKKEGKIAQEKSIAYIQQIIKGYSYIYDARIIHRNLQPTSILNAGLELKIADFSDSIKQSETELAKLRQELVGNLHYQPYQTLSEYKYSTKSDIYSIGAILFCMLYGIPPYQGLNKAEILTTMNGCDIRTKITAIQNPKVSQFLLRTLQKDQNLRMDAQQLINFQFQSMPQLNKLKLYTFDDKDSILVEEQIGKNKSKVSMLQDVKQVNKQKEVEQSMKMLFRNFDTSEKKFSVFDLKVSDQDQLSKYYKDRQISIFIPTKMDLPQPDESSIMIDNLGLDRIQSIQKRPSQGLPLKKKAATNKTITNNTYNDLLKSQRFMKNKNKNETARHLVIQTCEQLEQTNLQTKKIEQANKTSIPQEKSSSISIKITKQPQIVIPPLQFKQEKVNNRVLNNQNPPTSIFKPKTTTERSNIKGPFTLRGRQNFVADISKKTESRNSLIAAWLISQVDIFRFLNRVVFKIKKLAKNQLNELSLSLQKLKTQILNEIKNLTHLSRQDLMLFQDSTQNSKIREIIEAYQSKNPEIGQFEGFQKLNKLVLANISSLFNEISQTNQFKEEQLKLLDYLITLWQLLKLLKRHNLQQFHNKSKIAQILDSKQYKITIAHLLQIYQRMRVLKLI